MGRPSLRLLLCVGGGRGRLPYGWRLQPRNGQKPRESRTRYGLGELILQIVHPLTVKPLDSALPLGETLHWSRGGLGSIGRFHPLHHLNRCVEPLGHECTMETYRAEQAPRRFAS
ncbi:hypothetical protein GCM10007898_09740 [Dyella flagellata]|uniref:Secreted protein n=1 Tax=Dyella flagellata TaxID=1867833 RepID=A0ABQ5X764_9GAMM|nr:hypothetical protein GCM10007898_09740 [Dyella flagellata]